jgi:MFS family permease
MDGALARNPPLLCAFHALQMALFPMAVITLFWKHTIGFSMTEIMLLQAIFGLTVALLEFPSGYLADRFGYRRTLVTGALVAIAGWTFHASGTDFWTIAAGEVLLGVSLSLTSGADTALLYESLVETGREAEYPRWYARYRFAAESAEGTAALTAGVLFALWPRLPMAVEVGLWVVNAGVALALVEPARHRPPAQGNWQQMRAIVRHVGRENRRLLAVMLLATSLGITTFVPVWFIALYAAGAGVPVGWLGPIWAAANYSVALGSLASPRLGRRLGFQPALLLCVGLGLAGYLGLALSHALLGFAFYFVLTLMRGLHGGVLHPEEQRLIPSTNRAGFLSLRSLLFRGVFLVVGPAAGAGVDLWGVHAVLLVLGPLLALVSLAAWFRLGVTSAPRAS